MKKWQVLAAVLLLAVVGGMRLLHERASEPGTGLPGFKMLPEGVPLPADTTQYYIPEEFLAVPPRTGAPVSYGPLPTIKNEAYDRGLCDGGSLNDILSAHGRIWGVSARHAAFDSKETQKTYGLLGDYLGCVALSRSEPFFCDYLPGESAVQKIGPMDSPNYACRENFARMSFLAFMAGRTKSDLGCRLLLHEGRMPDGGPVPLEKVCGAAAAGMEKFCSSLSGSLDGKGMTECLRFAPASEKDCGGDGECLDKLAVYRALKAGNASACPENSRGACEAILGGSEAGCAVTLVRLGTEYCADLRALNKKTGGFPGLSPEETKAAIAEQARLRAEEEARSKEARRIEDDINKRVRRMLGREDGGEKTGETD